MSTTGVPFTIRRVGLASAAVLAFALAVASTSAVFGGVADPGVVPGLPGGQIASVSTTGYAWRYGIRAGQTVVDLSPADASQGWQVTTTDGISTYIAFSGPQDEALRDALPFAAASVISSALALLFLRTRRRWVVPAAAVSTLAASVPLEIQGQLESSTVALAGAAAMPIAGLLLRQSGPWQLRSVVWVGGAAFIGWWLAARLSGGALSEPLEEIRHAAAIAATTVLVLDRPLSRIRGREPMPLTRPRLSTVVVVAGVSGLAIALATIAGLPWLAVALLVSASLLALPRLQKAGRTVGTVLLEAIREEAATEAVEQERSRLARELHDVPLQELMGAIRRIELLPGTAGATDELRGIADHIRNVAVDLRPPVLDDFGLPAAIETLSEQLAGYGPTVRSVITNYTGLSSASRPPGDVEVAAYRIVREAVENAVRHSRGTNVLVSGTVSPVAIDLVVSDDGIGIGRSSNIRGERARHFGLASMRRRAETIDADLSVRSLSPGTEVRLTWRR